jgi:hypothetical protein
MFKIAFLMWTTLSEHKWTDSRKRRGKAPEREKKTARIRLEAFLKELGEER